MKAKYNILLALVIVLLVGYYAFFEVAPPPEEVKTLRGTPIYLIKPWDVKKVQVVGEDGKQVMAEREGDRWRLKKGKQADGFETKVEDFVVSLLMTVEIDKFPFEGNHIQECNLDSPRYTVTVTDITDKTYTLYAGDKTPVGTCLYVQFSDSPYITVVGALLDYELGKLDGMLD